MKKRRNLVFALCFLFALMVVNSTVTTSTVEAAEKLKFVKNADLMVGQEIGYGVMNSVKTDKIVKLKSSNTKVLAVSSWKSPENDYTINCKAKKAGTATVSFTVKRKNGKSYSFKAKIKVYKYTTPVSKIVVGKTDYTKKFEKNYTINVSGSSKKQKVTVKAKKGYKITGLWYGQYGDGTQKKIKNGSQIVFDANHYLRIDYKNTSKNYSDSLFIMGE